MNHEFQETARFLAIAPTTRGFGFAVLDSENTLIDFGCKSALGDKTAESLRKIEKLMDRFDPEVLVLQNMRAKNSRRAPRVKMLNEAIVSMAKTRRLKVASYSLEQVKKEYFHDGRGTKHALAQILATRFPGVADRLPPKRRFYDSEDFRMDIFDAVALAEAYWRKKK